MEPNNFEKKIQQKMDGLKIPPSDSVWINVEKRIGKKHKDRKVIFIIFFVILFLFTGGYWLFNATKNNTQQQNHPLSNLLEKNKPASPAGKQTNDQDSSSDDSIDSSEPMPETTDTFQAVTPKTKAPLTIIQRKANKNLANEEQKDVSLKMTPVAEDKIAAASSSQNKELKREKNINNEKDNKLDENNQQEREAEIAETKSENIPDQIAAQNKSNADTLLKKVEEKLTAKKPSKDLQKPKWIFGVTFSGGISLLSNEFLNMDKNNSDYLSMPNSPGSGVGNSGSGSGSSVRLPAKTTNSSAFIGGVFVQKNISKKSKISLGINYKRFSTINKTGSKIDSALTAYNSVTYPTTYTNTYRNNFNYLELPVSLKFQLTSNNSLPVYWLAGINISQLINSNALQFKSDPGIYYEDNSLFNKTQWGFTTGFFATLFSRKKTPVNIGPYFYYNATRLANEGLYNKKHFHFIGIKAEILFNKK